VEAQEAADGACLPLAVMELSEGPRRDKDRAVEKHLVKLSLSRITLNTNLVSRSSMSQLRHMYRMPPSLSKDVAFGDH
jgi:hypothetical protein